MESDFKNRSVTRKLFNAFYGALIPYKTEASIRIQTVLIMIGILLGFYFNISSADWIFMVIAAAILLITECLNTAIENLVDLVSPEYHVLAGKVKDISAGAVFMAGSAALIISVIVFLPYF